MAEDFFRLDELLLKRFRCFQKRLIKLPVSYKEAFSQGLIFCEVLDRVIEIPGPLHQAFHMVQCVFNIYQHFLKWCGSKVLC
mmetsp:Transcript_22030/g.30971  ORF Transcript_22030/g.30971 Transcript_22030/m.30971 type:complete len:82 (-) Transcript_22030:1125-1370(-)